MKFAPLPIVAFCFVLISLCACTEQASTSPEIQSPLNPTTAHQIDSTVAISRINAYEAYIDEVIDTLSGQEEFTDPGKRLVYGARVDLRELREILFSSDKQNELAEKDSLYVMMGIASSDSTELIFALKSGLNPSWKFFDFTMPCPNACPKFVDE